MRKPRPVAGGGRAVEVPPERVAGWYARFATRHGGVTHTVLTPSTVVVKATDGATATCQVPYAPLPTTGTQDGLAIEPLIEHLSSSRRVGLFLVRLGGHSVGVAVNGVIESSRTDRRQVHGRSAAGGWSQHRFARRREGQVRVALDSAATDAAELLVPQLSTLDAVILGGDHRALDTLRTDPRLADLFAAADSRVLDVPNPRRTVLDDAAQQARSIEIVIRDH